MPSQVTRGARLMVSVAGIRGVVGESLTPPLAATYAAAFARVCGRGEVVLGRDARRSGPMLRQAVAAGLRAAGCDVVDVGLATTPTVQVAVESLGARGGVVLTASHNPPEWNALKLLSSRGEFLDAATGAMVRARAEGGADLWVGHRELGGEREEPRALGWHLERVLGLPGLDIGAVRKRALKVAVDGCASVGGIALPRLLEELGCAVVRLDCEPSGEFTRELEPLPEHLVALGRAVHESGADLGMAVDPDADRLALVNEDGVPMGEEYTVALAARVVLARRRGPVVTNLSTSLMMDAVARSAGVLLVRTPVGEAHVVQGMRESGAVAGGEGNGGVIVPAAHYGRDALVGAALVCQALASSGLAPSELVAQLPRFVMWKRKYAAGAGAWDRAAERLRAAFQGMSLDERDGLRFSSADEWVHVRPSGTEPVVRVIAESPTESRTRELCERARAALSATA
jgi:phosphomannomutase